MRWRIKTMVPMINAVSRVKVSRTERMLSGTLISNTAHTAKTGREKAAIMLPWATHTECAVDTVLLSGCGWAAWVQRPMRVIQAMEAASGMVERLPLE